MVQYFGQKKRVKREGNGARDPLNLWFLGKELAKAYRLIRNMININ